MLCKKNWIAGFIVVLFLGFVSPATAQMKRIYKFQKVQLPFGIKIGDKVIPKGTYHFEFLRHQTQAKNYLRLCRGSKYLCCICGDEKQYATHGRMKLLDPDIPKHPRLQMFRDSRNGKLYVDFESGKKTSVYPFLKARFKFALNN